MGYVSFFFRKIWKIPQIMGGPFEKLKNIYSKNQTVVHSINLKGKVSDHKSSHRTCLLLLTIHTRYPVGLQKTWVNFFLYQDSFKKICEPKQNTNHPLYTNFIFYFIVCIFKNEFDSLKNKKNTYKSKSIVCVNLHVLILSRIIS